MTTDEQLNDDPHNGRADILASYDNQFSYEGYVEEEPEPPKYTDEQLEYMSFDDIDPSRLTQEMAEWWIERFSINAAGF